MQNDNSNKGNFSGNSKSTEQNAESGIRELSVKDFNNLHSTLQEMRFSFTNWINQQLDFGLDPKRYSPQEAYDPKGCNYFRSPLEAGHFAHMQWMTDGQKALHREGDDCKNRNIGASVRSYTLFKQIIIRQRILLTPPIRMLAVCKMAAQTNMDTDASREIPLPAVL